jgi:hypothetical protein
LLITSERFDSKIKQQQAKPFHPNKKLGLSVEIMMTGHVVQKPRTSTGKKKMRRRLSFAFWSGAIYGVKSIEKTYLRVAKRDQSKKFIN